MEQQKLLWTILSVGILVLILLGAGMFFFLPSDSTGLAQNGKTTEWSKAASPAPAAEQKTPDQKATPAPAQPPKPEVKKTPVQTAQTPAPAPKTQPEVKKTPAPTPAPAAKPATPAPKATPAPATKPAPAATTQQAKPAASTSTQQAAKPAQTQTTAAKPAATATAAKGNFWVQVGSYATTDAAEKTKKDLAAKGYTSSIQSITANGKTYHRVKIGPYASRAEVDTLLPKIKALPGMGDSFITTK